MNGYIFLLPQIIQSFFKLFLKPSWGKVHLADHFSSMAVASVTMFWACFSNGMSIMLPRKVKAPCKTENINFLNKTLGKENCRLGLVLILCCKTRIITSHMNQTESSCTGFRKSQAQSKAKIKKPPPQDMHVWKKRKINTLHRKKVYIFNS